MMMRIIEAGGIPALTDHLRQPDEDNPSGYFEFEPVKRTRTDPAWIGAAVGKAVKIVHLLLPDLPLTHAYRVVLMRRDLWEVVASQKKMLCRRNRDAGQLPTERWITLCREQLERVRRHMMERPEHFRFIEADYNHLVTGSTAPLEGISGLLDGLDLAAMLSVVDTRLYRSRATPSGGDYNASGRN
jgi:hypothetical protein